MRARRTLAGIQPLLHLSVPLYVPVLLPFTRSHPAQVDGDFLRDAPYKLFENGKFLKVPVLFG